jgi:hypothetical protein
MICCDYVGTSQKSKVPGQIYRYFPPDNPVYPLFVAREGLPPMNSTYVFPIKVASIEHLDFCFPLIPRCLFF